MKLFLGIPDVPPSLNKRDKMHWSQKHKLTKSWESMLWAAIRSKSTLEHKTFLRGRGHAAFKMRVTTAQYRKGQLDNDNMEASMKPVYDALVRLGVLYDDKPEYLESNVSQMRCVKGEIPHTVIIIEKCDLPLASAK